MQISTIPVQPKEEKTCSLVEIQILTCKNNMMLPICFSSRRITYLQLPFSVKLIEFVHSVYISVTRILLGGGVSVSDTYRIRIRPGYASDTFLAVS